MSVSRAEGVVRERRVRLPGVKPYRGGPSPVEVYRRVMLWLAIFGFK